MTLGEYIRAYREAHGESQRSFAARCGLSNTNISFIERGINPNTGKPIAPDVLTLQKISNAMGVSVQDIIASTDDFVIDLIPVRTFADDAEPLLDAWTDKLNEEGRNRLMDYLDLLLGNPKYTK